MALALFGVALAGASASAHRLDEYLQAVRVAIDPDRVRIDLDLTPGVSVAGAVLADIDRDRDGSISPREMQAYVARVVRDFTLQVDGAPVGVDVRGNTFPTVESLRNGEGTIQLRLAAAVPALRPGAHHIRVRNDHLPAVSVYLANSLVPASGLVDVTNQRRDDAQRALDIDYVLRDDNSIGWWGVAFGGAGVLALVAFVVQQKGTP